MSVIPEEKLLDLLDSCLSLSQRSLAEIRSSEASTAASPELVQSFAKLVTEIHGQKAQDTVLADESWEWIWKVKESMTPIQIYGRLAFVNYNLIDLL